MAPTNSREDGPGTVPMENITTKLTISWSKNDSAQASMLHRPGADVASDHDLLMMTFRLRLKNTTRKKGTRIRFDLQKLRDPEVNESFQAMIGGRFAPLSLLNSNELDIETAISTFNEAIIDTATKILGKPKKSKQPWVTKELHDLCDARRALKHKKKDVEGGKRYKEANQKVKKGMKKAKEDWIEQQCTDIKDSLNKYNTRKGTSKR